VRWSVGIEAEAGRVLSREEVVELAGAAADDEADPGDDADPGDAGGGR
jgi:hypothetical protein